MWALDRTEIAGERGGDLLQWIEKQSQVSLEPDRNGSIWASNLQLASINQPLNRQQLSSYMAHVLHPIPGVTYGHYIYRYLPGVSL